MTEVIIPRRLWSRGNQAFNALLVTEERIRREEMYYRDDVDSKHSPFPKAGTLCCLGHAARALGATDEELADATMPGSVNRSLPGLNEKSHPNCYSNASCKWTGDAVKINDDKVISEAYREAQLIILGEANGFRFVFVD